MLDNLIPQKLLFGNGTTQSQRLTDALDPASAVPDERSPADLLALTQAYARFVQFYGPDDQPAGTWEAFLPGPYAGPVGETSSGQLLAGPAWLADIAAYLRDPRSFADQPEKLEWLSRPHLGLFLAFLKLLEHSRKQLNSFTGRHLDYYYHQVLGLSVEKPVPDLAHVVVALAKGVNALFLAQNTALLAGKDSLGKDLIYRVNKGTSISRAQVQRSLRLYEETRIIIKKDSAKQKNRLPVPPEVWRNVFMADDARPGAATAARPALLGFAVASAQLALAEGARTITLTCAFQADATGLDAAQAGLNAQSAAVTWLLSNQKGWFGVRPVRNPVFGHFVVGTATKPGRFTVQDDVPSPQDGLSFTADNIGDYLVAEGGEIYVLTAPATAGAARVNAVLRGKASAGQVAGLYRPAGVYLNAMQVQFQLLETDPPVEAPGAAGLPLRSDSPVLAMLLNQPLPDAPKAATQEAASVYHLLKELKLSRVRVEVAVAGIRALRLQNDDAVLNAKKPFEPFGYLPQPGSSLYIAHPELSNKPLDSLTLQPQWMGLPADFKGHYENYWKIRTPPAKSPEALINANSGDAFTASLKVVDRQVAGAAHEVKLMASATGWAINSFPDKSGRRAAGQDADEAEPLEWGRYFLLELKKPDFQHAAYASLLTQQALLDPTGDKAELRRLPLNPPYTPKLKALTADYTASFQIGPDDDDAALTDRVFHLGPLGYKVLRFTSETYWLPRLMHSSELLLGLHDVDAPQPLSLFFQLADGAVRPDLTPGLLVWSYLADNEWHPLGAAAVLSDTTNGLLNTGILELALPARSQQPNTWLPDGLYWLKVGFDGPPDALPDIIDVRAQGLSVTFADQGNAPDHLLAPLPPGRITKPVADIPGIAKIQQPYSSSKGRPAETAPDFYNRVSERLRHKNRALALWDYERMVLEGFPQLYKVKCLPAASKAPGGVDIIVIPDIRGSVIAGASEPRVSAAVLLQIQQLVAARAPAYAAVTVKNPSYLRVQVRAAVKIRDEYGKAHATQQLQAELKRYLAPWAYEEGEDIVVGSRLYPDMVVNFIAEKSYVEFAAKVELFLSEDGKTYINARRLIYDSAGNARPLRPDVVLVSAPEHILDVYPFEEQLLAGIGYMKVGLDFEVG